MGTEEEPKKEKFLKKAERVVCWGARDDYWSCLDKLSPGQEGSQSCEQLRTAYSQVCPPSWVVHFDRKYQYEKFKARLKTDGFEKVDIEYDGKGNKSEKR